VNFFQHLKKMDWLLISSSAGLVGFGLISLYSSGRGSEGLINFQKQLIFFVISIFLMIAVSFIDWRTFKNDPYLILALYFICVAALVGLLIFAPSIRNIKGWYKLGPVSIDPREFTKVALLILLAKYFSMRHVEMYRFAHILVSGLYVALPSLLAFLQPDLGSVLVFFSLWMVVLLISGIKLRHFLILSLCGMILFLAGWFFFLRDYQKDRIMSFVSPQLEPLGIGWSQNQAKIAIGSGGILGQGIGKGSQTQYGFLTEPQTDFIFSAIAEETGLIGVTILFILFLVLLWRIILVAVKAETNFPRLFSAGLATLLVVNIFINIGMNLGILPIVGLPLPLVSYGGSGLIATFLAFGLLQNIKINQ